MIKFNVSNINPDYNFDIYGVSYIGKPISNTIMYVSLKIADKICKLDDVENCLVFAETGIQVSDRILEKNAIIIVDNPQLEYAKAVTKIFKLQQKEDAQHKYIFHEGGYYISEKAVIGENAYIEPGCRIGHNVKIGNNAILLTGTIINHADIGNNFISNEYAVIGANGFTMTKDENSNMVRIPTLGKVIIGNNVEVGVHNNISRGSAGNTVIEDNVKLDAFVHIGHDVIIKKNAQIVAGVVTGGFDVIGNNAYIGLNATLKNRIEIGDNAKIGMSAAVIQSLDGDGTFAGNPARKYR